MGVIKVETFDVDVSSNGQVYNLTNALPSTQYGFYRNTNPRGHSGGPVGNTGNSDPDDMSGYGFVSSTTQLELGRQLGTVKMAGEVWRYTGAGSGADEFIVRDRIVVTLTGSGPSTGNVVSGISDRNKCVCFITGKTCTQTSRNNMAEMGAIAFVADDGTVTVERGTGTSTLVVYITVVEFVGSNWKVGYSKFAFSSGNKTVYTDSRGDTGGTDNIDWSKAMIVEARQSGGNGSNDAIEDMSFVASNGGASTVSVAIGTSAANTGSGFIYVLENANLSIGRTTASKTIGNNNTYVTEAFPGGVTLTDLEESAVEWTVLSDGTGTAHGRGSLNARLTGLTSIESWVHRSGNTGTYRYGAVNLSALADVAALVITDVDGDDTVNNNQTGVVITGVAFGASQGTGTVVLAENPDGSGTSITQTVTNWTDTAITIDLSSGVLADTNSFIVVTTDGATAQGSRGVQVGIPPITLEEFILGTSPDHYWPLNGSYDDIVAALNWSVRTGSPTFTANPLTLGRTSAWTVTAQDQEAGPANSNAINGQTETVRTMGGWIELSQIQNSFVMLYEEGGSINNVCFVIGIGNILIAQYADTGDDNVHAYSSFPLQPNRRYRIDFRFDHGGTQRFELLIDGDVQPSTFGNPLTSGDLDAHSGDIAFGNSSDSLEVFGTDINFPAALDSYFQDWASWTTFQSDATLREMTERGVRGDIQIISDTQANMQAAVSVFADTVRPDSDCVFRIAACTEGDFTLDFDNITFDEGTTFQIQYLGADTLTVRNLNGSNITSDKISTVNGGTVVIIEPVQVNFVVLDFDTLLPIENARVYVTAINGGPIVDDTVIINQITAADGVANVSIDYSADQDFRCKVRKGSESPFYKSINFTDTITSSGINRNVFLVLDE